MNLFKLKQMITEGNLSTSALRYLIECHGECEYLDYKAELHLDSDYNKVAFAKDAVAMKNVGGGYIVIGVRDKTWEPIGLQHPMNEDTKLLRDIIRKTTGLDLQVDIVKHSIPIQNELKEFAIILVRGPAKRTKLRVPSLCKVGFRAKESWGIRDGDIYFRRSDETVRIQGEELEELLYDLIAQEDKSAIEQQKVEPSPFMVEDGLYRILPSEYDTFIERLSLQNTLRQLIEGDPRIWIINVYGPGGVGKSTLVSWLANYYYQNKDSQNTFQAILHLSAKDTQLTESGIKQLRPTLYSLENLVDSILFLFDFDAYIEEELEEKKELAQTLLSDYKTLLILDNMETVRDGRVLQFVASLPPTNRSKVLLTSRLRSSGWEKPLQVSELSMEEVKTFLQVKAKEKKVGELKNFDSMAQRVYKASGGLPLAIEWILGQYALTGNFERVLNQVPSPDSPLLEFSFNTSWNFLLKESQEALAVLSIFDDAPTRRLWSVALGWPTEKVEQATNQLIEATLVFEKTNEKTGQITYHMLPITRDFARNKLKNMGDVELTATTAYRRHLQQMELVAEEMQPYSRLFENFGVQRNTEKQAIILARKAESQASYLNYDEAEKLYKEAQSIDPRSVYVLVKYGLFKSDVGQIGEAIALLRQATLYANKNIGFFIYYNFSQVYDKIKDRKQVEYCLEKALDYKPDHLVARHQLGVVKSRLGKFGESRQIFDDLIEHELKRDGGPTDTLVYTYTAKIINCLKAKDNDQARQVKLEAIDELKRWPHLVDKIYQLQNIMD